MKFPSLKQLGYTALAVLKRFPIPILFAVLGTRSLIALTVKDLNNTYNEELVKGAYIGNLGLALTLAFALFAEKHKLRNSIKIGANVTLIAFLFSLSFILNPFEKEAHILMLVILAFAFHLLVSVAAFHKAEENQAFWQLNKSLFLRFLTSALYSAVLFIGISIALLSIEELFKVNWDDKIYLRLWLIIAGVFNTLFFLSGIPKPLETLQEEQSYPKGLKIFTQYVLIPLASIYLVILLAYEGKILLEWHLPNGFVSVLILGYAVFGMLSLLLVHPLRSLEENKWIKLFSKTFYLFLIPLIILLVLAVYTRVSDYGITESRYILIVLTFWLSFITFYFLIKGQEHIRIIPISLCALALIISFGPWGLQSVSKNSQQKILSTLLATKPNKERDQQIRNIVDYLYDYHGIMALQPFTKASLSDIKTFFKNSHKKDSLSQFQSYQAKENTKDSVLKLLGLNPLYNPAMKGNFYNFANKEKEVLSIEKASILVTIENQSSFRDDKCKEITAFGKAFKICKEKEQELYLVLGKEKLSLQLYKIGKQLLKKSYPITDKNYNTFQVPNKDLTLTQQWKGLNITIRIEEIGIEEENQETSILHYKVYVLITPQTL
ncbi:DUF4153 domain-containing protein [Pedobacter glucosidilyticus]|uniref:DUF4153 domain-containing protein n=1 Tax=Pedobacter glucosidilyticus TaxID=1122941 RepID=UPI0026EBAE9C|nr:DUF4153 domain-containing protein [Pedobacter glucosidilyticus]